MLLASQSNFLHKMFKKLKFSAINLAEQTWNDFDSSDFCSTMDRVGVFVFAGASVK